MDKEIQECLKEGLEVLIRPGDNGKWFCIRVSDYAHEPSLHHERCVTRAEWGRAGAIILASAQVVIAERKGIFREGKDKK